MEMSECNTSWLQYGDTIESEVHINYTRFSFSVWLHWCPKKSLPGCW